MIAKANLQIGGVSYQFEVEEKDEMDTMHKIIVLCNPPTKCDECGAVGKDKFKLDSNKDTEGNTYINVFCFTCLAKAKIGRYKTGGYFWHKFEKYVKKEEGNKI